MEPTSQPTYTSTYYFSVFRRRRRIIIAGALIGALLGVAYVATRPGGYSSSASVVVRQVVTDPRGDDNSRGVSAQTEKNIMASTVVAQRVAEVIDREVDPEDLLKRLTVDIPEDTGVVNSPQDTLVLTSSFSASTPERARAGAQAFADEYLAFRQSQYEAAKDRTLANIDVDVASLTNASTAAAAAGDENQVDLLAPRILDAQSDRQLISSVDTTAGDVIRPARLPTGTNGISSALAVIALTVLGAIAGVVIALVRQRTDPFLRTRQDFVEAFGKPPVAEIGLRRPRRPGRPSPPPVPELAEYRHLRVRLWSSRPADLARVLVTDVSKKKTSARLVAGIAASLSAANWRVLVIWPDDPTSQFDVSPLVDLEGVRLVAWSEVDGFGGDAIDTTSLVKVLDEAAGIDDVVLLTGSPVLSSAEGPELYPLVDGVLVSFDPQEIRTETLDAALEEVTTMGGEVAGVVVSPVPVKW